MNILMSPVVLNNLSGGNGGGKIKQPWIPALLISLSMFICIFPLSASVEDSYASDNDVISDSISNKNILKVKADYVVTVPTKVKVYYKVRKKVKIKYKKRGKWRTKYKKVWVYRYYYKTVYMTYTVRDIPPNECKAPSANCQPTDPNVLNKARELSAPIEYTENNTEPRPEEPTLVEKPAEVANPGVEPTLEDFGGCETQFQDAWNVWNEYNTTYTNFLTANQTYTEYLQKLEAYQNYQPIINKTRNQTSMEKAQNIFYWVRDHFGYSFYYNTKYGASGALNAGTGNCVDTAHLVIALARACGIPARYIHGTCTFKVSGHTYGHVWAQLYVDGKWYNCDATSLSNSFGVINSWYTSTYILKGIYSSLPF